MTDIEQPAVTPELPLTDARALGPRRAPRWMRSLLPSLIPSEARVAEALLENLPDIATSVAELAAQAQASPATVIRACQSLGFSGFNELRDALRDAEKDASQPAPEGRNAYEALHRTAIAGIEQLQNMIKLVDPEVFERTVDALIAAPRVLVATTSDLALLGQYAMFRFAMVGRVAESSPDPVTAHLLATGLAPGDVCVAIGSSGASLLTVRIVQAAAAAGATIVSITSFARGPLADLADLHLVVGMPDSHAGERDHRRIRASQLVMIDALQAAIRDRGHDETVNDAMFATLSNYTYRRSRHEARPRPDPDADLS